MAERTVRLRLEALTQQFSSQFRAASQTVRTEGRAMMGIAQKNSAAFTAAGVAMGAAGAAIAMGLRSAGREAAEFESRLTKSTTLIGVAADEMRRMGDAALRMSDTGRGPQELADSLFFAQSAGLRGAEALAVVEASAKAASIGLGDTATITDLVTSAVNAYGAETLSASEATDTLIGTVREGKAEASELAGSMGRVLPIASNMGITLDQVGAAMAAMTRTGTNAAESATQLRSIMLGLLKPTAQAEEALAGVGLSASGLRQTIQDDGLWQALQQLKTAVGDNDDVMAQIFPNVRALAGVMDLTGASAEATGQIFDNMTDTVGLTADGFEEWSKTTEASQQRFSASMEAVKIAAGDSIQGPLKAFLDVGTGLNQMFVDLPPVAQGFATALGAAAAATGLLGGAALVALPRIAELKRALQSMGATRTLGALSATKSLLMGPWGVAMGTAVVALGAFAKAKAEQEERIEAVIATLDDETGALTENTNSWLLNRLEQRRMFERAAEMNITRGELIRAIKGEEAALESVNRELEREKYTGNARAAAALSSAIGGITGELDESQDRWRQRNEDLAEAEGRYFDVTHMIDSGLTPAEASLRLHMQAAGDAADEQGGSLDGLQDELEETVAPAEALVDVLDRLIGVHVDARGAQIRMLDSLDKLAGGFEENGTSLDINTEAGRENLGMIHDAIDSITTLAERRLDEGASVSAVTGEILNHVDALNEELREAGLTEQAIAELNAEYGLIPSKIITTIFANTGEAEAALDRLLAKLTQATGIRHVNVEGSGVLAPHNIPKKHSGGWVTASERPPSDVAAMMGLSSDEVPTTLQTGELVLSRSQASALTTSGGTTNNTTSVGRQVSGNTINVYASDADSGARAASRELDMYERGYI